ncbi:GNAT family N-acetyltransferase [Pedobacter gandavensis]|uniref:GNAT family N-acetyltransferase n=1 Tax=Pedobacter gandavensis TaxID=2679963 RepID=A0ABR6EYK2_9SPHI|nr:GNAT family N-acetyltransferase [Pedobacter gandavensis]MBB2150362.1 GNAT family N-acetyltransferase [Pedobacter gandavensis]
MDEFKNFDFERPPVLESDRLLLRELTQVDAPALFKLRSNEEVMKYVPRPKPANIEEVHTFINEIHHGFLKGKNLGWAVTIKEGPDVLIGFIGFPHFDFNNFRAEVGYMIAPGFWGKGIAGEALALMHNFGFEKLGLHSVFAVIDPNNVASAKVLLKQGYVKEAYFKEDFYYNGEFLDSEIYSLLNSN